MINSVMTIPCEDCNGNGVIFFGNENDFDVETCDCQDGNLFLIGENE
jgi:hypothetical protein